MDTSRWSIVVASLVSVLLAAVPACAQGPLAPDVPSQGFLSPDRFVSASASASQCDATGCTSVSASRVQGGAASQTYLYYSSFSWVDFHSSFGFGVIPDDALAVNGQSGKASVHVDTNAVPGFTITECSFDGCFPRPGGLIDVQWTPDGVAETVSHSESTSTWFGVTSHGTFRFRQQSADAAGSILGQDLAPVAAGTSNGWVSTQQQMTH